MHVPRSLEPQLRHHLARGKSILLLGPRQTGKTTLIAALGADLTLSLVSPRERQRYERDASLLAGEVRALAATTRRRSKPLLVAVDEVQKVPAIMDVGQELIDSREAQFVFTGSSARKLRRGRDTNLLPGRVVAMRLDPLTIEEHPPSSLDEALTFGSLPGIRTLQSKRDKEVDLRSYVETYLEEEVRQEALVRNIGAFGRFLELAGQESGHSVNHTRVSRDVGVSAVTINAYYQILCDCLVAERIDPITRSASRKKLTRSSRYLLFDLGIRRAAAGEGTRPHRARAGELFEQFIGLEVLRFFRLRMPEAKLRFWRDPDGPEVAWVLERAGEYLPIEVKLTERPAVRDARHVELFLDEYGAKRGLLVCTTPRPVQLSKRVTAIPWGDLLAKIGPDR